MVCLRAVDCLLLTNKLLANGLSIIDTDIKLFKRKWPVGLMDKASASGAGDSRFESWAGQNHYLPLEVCGTLCPNS